MNEEDITIQRGGTKVTIKGRLLRRILVYPPLLNALILTGVLVLLLLLLDLVGVPLLTSELGIAWNFTEANGFASLFVLAYLGAIGYHYYTLLRGKS